MPVRSFGDEDYTEKKGGIGTGINKYPDVLVLVLARKEGATSTFPLSYRQVRIYLGRYV
jgi:hypothetical protein